METQIEKIDMKLVGLQRVFVFSEDDIPAGMKELFARLSARINSIPNIGEPRLLIGYWQFIDQNTRVYFMGIQVDSLEDFKWDHAYGLGAWDLGVTTFAKWRERNSEMGTVSQQAHGALSDLGYSYDGRFLGEFEAFPLDERNEDGSAPEDGWHEFWLPVVPKK